ncbi:hypothetical protein AAMO2058_001386200 [Amorphochlora amoebiformis]
MGQRIVRLARTDCAGQIIEPEAIQADVLGIEALSEEVGEDLRDGAYNPFLLGLHRPGLVNNASHNHAPVGCRSLCQRLFQRLFQRHSGGHRSSHNFLRIHANVLRDAGGLHERQRQKEGQQSGHKE